MKTIGDAIMLRIPDPGQAILLGLHITHGLMLGHGAPAVRVGLHHGSAIERDDDYFGAAVNLAARVSGVATGGEVLLTAHTAALAPELEGVFYEPRGREALRNIREPVELFAAVRTGEASEGNSRGSRLPDGSGSRPRSRPAHARRHRLLLLHARLRGRVRSPTRALRAMSNARPAGPIGSITWTERTGGVLTARECVSLAGPLVRDELRILSGRLAMALRRHSGRRNDVDPASLTPPDSALARDAEQAAKDLLPTTLLNHSRRAHAWGAAIAALNNITFDRELLYMAAMFHDTGLPSPVPNVDFTVRSAKRARDFTDRHGMPADDRELVTNAIAMHHTPGVSLEHGAEAYLLSVGAGLDVFGLRSDEIPDGIRQSVVEEFPRLGFKREFAGLWRAEARKVPRGRAWYLRRFAMTDVSIRLAPFRD